MLRGRVAGGSGACYALRRDAADDAPGAAQPATLFVTDWTPAGSRAATFDLRAVMRELTNLYGAPPPARGGEWERLATALGRTGGALEAGADVATAALVTQHMHGHRPVDVRLPPGDAPLAPVSVEEALEWMQAMYAESEAALEQATRVAEPPPPVAGSPEAALAPRPRPGRKRGAGTALMDGDAIPPAASWPPDGHQSDGLLAKHMSSPF